MSNYRITAKRETISALKGYYDISTKIIDCAETIKNLKMEESIICPPASKIAEMPTQKKNTDFVADAGTGEVREKYEREIAEYRSEIDKLDNHRRLIKTALNRLTQKERKVIEVAYLGPRNLQERMRWRGEPWKVVGDKVGYSESQAHDIAAKALSKVEEYISQSQNCG